MSEQEQKPLEADPSAVPRWNPMGLKQAMEQFSGKPPQEAPLIDESPNKGSGWLGR